MAADYLQEHTTARGQNEEKYKKEQKHDFFS